MNHLWLYLFEVSCCLCLFYLLYYIVLRQVPAFNANRIYLLLSYPVSFLIPLLSLNIYPVFYETIIPSNTAETLGQNIPENIAHTSALNYFDIIFIIYIFIVFLFFIKMIINILSIFKIIYSNKKQYLNDHILVLHNTPKIYSFFHYLLHPQSADLSPEIIEHELTHIRQKHSIDIIVSEIVKAVLWINPVVYLLQRAIKLNHEYICDRKASEINGAYDYAKLLARYSIQEHHLMITNNFSYKLKNRIIMLQHSVNSRSQIWRYLLIFLMLIGALNLFAFEEYYVPITQNEVSSSDTIPTPDIKTVTVTDTILVFDPATKKETMSFMTYEEQVVEVIDTIFTFDPDTFEERRSIVKRDIPLDEYQKITVKEEVNKISEPMVGDTIFTFDPATGEETMEVIGNKAQCYTFFWGEYAFSGTKNVISKSQFKSLLDKEFSVVEGLHCDSEEVHTFVGEFAIVPNNNKAVLQLFYGKSKYAKLQQFTSIPPFEEETLDGTLIFISKMKVNGKPIDDIRIEVK